MLDREKRGDMLITPMRARNKGFTLVELMVTIALLAILLGLAAPAFSEMIRNSQVRTVADGIQTGLRTAQAESVRKSRQMVFFLTNDPPSQGAKPAINGSNWVIFSLPHVGEEKPDGTPAAPAYIQGGSTKSDRAAGVAITGTSAVCFSSNGRISNNAATGITGATCNGIAQNYDVSTASATKKLRVQLAIGGQVRMCDLTKPAEATDGCT